MEKKNSINNKRGMRVLLVQTLKEEELPLPTTDAAAIDLWDQTTWPQMSLLIGGKFLASLEAKSLPESEAFEHGRLSPERSQDRFDEFIVEQARIIGTRILFNPTVLLRLFAWSQNGESGAKRWRSFAKNIQDNLDHKPLVINHDRIPLMKDELIAELKALKKILRSRKAISVAWDLELHINNIDVAQQNFQSEVLASNITIFKAFVRDNEDMFRAWLLGFKTRLTDTKMAEAFIGHTHGYKSRESTRQAIQKIKRRRTPRAKGSKS